MLEKFELDDRAQDYVTSVLSEAGTLARLINENLRQEVASSFTFAPKRTSPAQLYRFREGGLFADGSGKRGAHLRQTRISSSGREHLASFVSGMLSAHRESCCVMENVLARCTDPWLQDWREFTVCYGNEVYFIARTPTPSGQLEELVGRAETMPTFYGVLTKSAHKATGSGKGLPGWVLEEWRNSWKLLFAGAYDGEGYIFIEKST